MTGRRSLGSRGWVTIRRYTREGAYLLGVWLKRMLAFASMTVGGLMGLMGRYADFRARVRSFVRWMVSAKVAAAPRISRLLWIRLWLLRLESPSVPITT